MNFWIRTHLRKVQFLHLAIACCFSSLFILLLVSSGDLFKVAKFDFELFGNTKPLPQQNYSAPSSANVPLYAHFGHIVEPIPFKMEFKWPPFDVNLRTEVNRALNGLQPLHPPMDHWAKFPQIHSPNCKEAATGHMSKPKDGNNSLLIIVRSGAERYEHRAAVRDTYATVRQLKMKDRRDFHFRTIFVMGKGNRTEMERVDEEARKFNDLLVADFDEGYYTCTLKFISAIKFGHQNCFSAKPFPFVLLIDDNYLLLPWNLADHIVKRSPEERLYTGGMLWHLVSRNYMDKWSVNLSQYPFDEYPPFVSGGGVLMSRRTVHELFVAIQHTHLFIFDDVYTGILAHFLNISAEPNPFFMADRPIALTSNSTQRPIDAPGWWQNVIAAMDFSPDGLRTKYNDAERLLNGEYDVKF